MTPTTHETLRHRLGPVEGRIRVEAWDRRDEDPPGCMSPGRVVAREFPTEDEARAWLKDKGPKVVQTLRMRPRDRVMPIEELTGHQGAIAKMLGED